MIAVLSCLIAGETAVASEVPTPTETPTSPRWMAVDRRSKVTYATGATLGLSGVALQIIGGLGGSDNVAITGGLMEHAALPMMAGAGLRSRMALLRLGHDPGIRAGQGAWIWWAGSMAVYGIIAYQGPTLYTAGLFLILRGGAYISASSQHRRNQRQRWISSNELSNRTSAVGVGVIPWSDHTSRGLALTVHGL